MLEKLLANIHTHCNLPTFLLNKQNQNNKYIQILIEHTNNRMSKSR